MIATRFDDVKFLHTALRIYPMQVFCVLEVRHVAVGISRDRYDRDTVVGELVKAVDRVLSEREDGRSVKAVALERFGVFPLG